MPSINHPTPCRKVSYAAVSQLRCSTGICAIFPEENRCQSANLLLEEGKDSLAEIVICVTITV